MKRTKRDGHITICGEQSGDWFRILCNECGTETDNEYLAANPPIRRIRSTCKNCGASTELKLQSKLWRGLPVTPHR